MTSSRSPSPLLWLARAIGLAAAYFLAGRLTQLFASPPGVALAVFPPAGLALAGLLIMGSRLWPGIWLGALAFNAWAFFGHGDAPDISALSALAIAAVQGGGATLQAVVGAALVRRLASPGAVFDHGRDILVLLVLGGPVACLVSATVGVSTLVVGGILPPEAAQSVWGTWWFGDTIGVLIVAPLVLAGWLQPAARRLRWLAGVPLPVCLGLVTATMLFLLVRGWEVDRIRLTFERRADGTARALRESIGVHLEVLHSIRSHFSSVTDVSRDEFRRFVSRSLARHRGIHALEWVPRVGADERARFERAARDADLDDFEIREQGPDGRMIRAADRTEHFPVCYVEPLRGNEAAMGFDLASDPARLEALRRAEATGRAVATPPIRLVQETGDQDGFLVVVPVFDEVAGERGALRGHVVGVFRIGDVVAAAMLRYDAVDIEMCVYDAAQPGHAPMFCSAGATDLATGGDDEETRLTFARVVMVARRRWSIVMSPAPAFREGQRTWQAWGVLAGALLFTGLMEAFLLYVSGRTARIEEVVAQRTEALSRTAAELRLSRDEAEAASRSKSEFLANMSHELRTPLNAILGYSQLMREEARDRGQDSMIADLDRVRDAGQHLLELIDGVLDLSKIESGRMDLHLEPFDVPTLIDEVAATVRPLVTERGNVLVIDCPDDPWIMSADPTKTRQVLLNLLSNAAKFTENGTISVTAAPETEDGEEWVRFAVSDSGIGIAPDQIDHVFEQFTQGDTSATREHGGTGLGLAIARRFCEMMGGAITVRSAPDRGSTFTVRLPVRVAEEGET
jgi:signal transduction histidine kinase/integral membrane sensor domain MASE1